MAMKRFKNGNIHFKLDEWDFINENESDVINFIQLHEELLLIGDEFCISNYEMGFLLYDWYSDSFYIISFTDCETFMQGKTVIAYPRNFSADERKEMNSLYDCDLPIE